MKETIFEVLVNGKLDSYYDLEWVARQRKKHILQYWHKCNYWGINMQHSDWFGKPKPTVEIKATEPSTIKSMIGVIVELNHINLEIIKIKAECSEF